MMLGYLPQAFEEGATHVDRAALEVAKSLGITVKPVTLGGPLQHVHERRLRRSSGGVRGPDPRQHLRYSALAR